MNRSSSGFLLSESLLAIALSSLLAIALVRLVIWTHRAASGSEGGLSSFTTTAPVGADALRTFSAFRQLLSRTAHATLVDAPLPDAAVLPAAQWQRHRRLPTAPADARAELLAAGFLFVDQPGCTLFLFTASGAPLGVLTVISDSQADGTWQVVRLAPVNGPPRGFRWRHPAGVLVWRHLHAEPPHRLEATEIELPDPSHPRARSRHVLPHSA